MSRDNIDIAKEDANKAVASLKKYEENRLADQKADQKKTKADTKYLVNDVKANEKADVAYLKKHEENELADEKADQKKTKADTENSVDNVKANEKAKVAKLKSDKSKVGAERRAAYRKADVTANIEKAKSNTKHYKTYAAADAERIKTYNK